MIAGHRERAMAFDLQSTRALAHKLYCFCQEPLSVHKPLSRSVRTLRNKLEEADEALDETSVQPKDIRVLQAAGESRDVLNRLDRARQRFQDQSPEAKQVEHDRIAKLLTDIDAATRTLSDALEGLEQRSRSLLLSSTSYDGGRDAQSPFTPTASSDDGHKMSATSSSWSFDSRPESMSERTSLQSDATGSNPKEEKQVVTASNLNANARRRSPLGGTQRWKAPFAYFDPMSVDIESASAHILRSETRKARVELPAPMKTPGTIEEASLKRLEPKSKPLDGLTSELSVMDIEQPTRFELHETQAVNHIVVPPLRRTSQLRAHAPFCSSHGTSRYRVVNPDASSVAGPDLCISGGLCVSPVTKPVVPSLDRSRQSRISMVQRTPSLAARHIQVTSRHASAEEVRPDGETVHRISRYWNEGQWDQARTYLATLLDHCAERRSLRLIRRLSHLLGVVASLQGQWYRALGHFAAVFDTTIQEASELDIGHCAAAHWMGDVYALLNRQDEAFFAYSLVTRSPLLQDSRWQPLRHCLQSELDACRSNASTAYMNFGWDHGELVKAHESSASILEFNIIDRGLARTILETELQSASCNNGERCNLDQDRSRAMTLSESGFQFGSWQVQHRLQLDASAFVPSEPWPMIFDPYFTMENVRRYRLLVAENDLFQSGISAAKIPKKRSLSFSCQDLRWLVLTIRKALVKSQMEWSEVVEQSPTFMVRVPTIDDGVATFHYFSIPIYRLFFRPGYGVDLCPEGICSARIRNRDQQLLEKGVDREETKRVRKVLRDYLDTALKRHDAMESSAMPVMSLNGVTSLHRR